MIDRVHRLCGTLFASAIHKGRDAFAALRESWSQAISKVNFIKQRAGDARSHQKHGIRFWNIIHYLVKGRDMATEEYLLEMLVK